MKIAIAGKNMIAIKAIRFILQKGYDKKSILVCTNKTDIGEDLWQPSLKKFAKANDIKIVNLKELYELKDLLFFSLEFDRIIKPDRFKSKRLFNIHFSFLPYYKGMYTSCLPLLNGEFSTGVSLHYIDKGIDTGDLIDQEKFDIPVSSSSRNLYEMYLDYGLNLFIKSFDSIISENINRKIQPSMGSTYYSKTTIDFTKIYIDFNQTAFQVHNQIRAFVFRPYQLPKIDDISIVHSSITSEKSKFTPGTIEQNTKFFRVYSTIDFNVKVYFDRQEEILDAAAKNDLEKLKMFYFMGYDMGDKNDVGWDPLIVASFNGAFETVKFLIDIGCDINSTNNKGTSVLMYALTEASKSGDLSIIEYLIDYGADLEHKDWKGVSIMNYAEAQGNPVVIKFISKNLITNNTR